MKYDDASWHYGGDFPEDLDPAAGATHIAMFLAWAVTQNLDSVLHLEEFAEDRAQLLQREMTPATWFRTVCDEQLTDEDLNTQGNLFAQAYFTGEGREHTYFKDYGEVFAEAETLYHVSDSWQNFDRLAPLLTQRYTDWAHAR
jgi:hypothetical protein